MRGNLYIRCTDMTSKIAAGCGGDCLNQICSVSNALSNSCLDLLSMLLFGVYTKESNDRQKRWITNFQNNSAQNWNHDAVVTKADELIMAQKV